MSDRKRPFPHFKFPDEINIEIKRIPDESCSWYGVPKGSYEARCTNHGWFPTELVAGVFKGRYTQGYGISIDSGYLDNRNLGTMGNAFDNCDKVAKILIDKGYNVTIIK